MLEAATVNRDDYACLYPVGEDYLSRANFFSVRTGRWESSAFPTPPAPLPADTDFQDCRRTLLPIFRHLSGPYRLLDVGSYVGETAIQAALMSRLGFEVTVDSFEPTRLHGLQTQAMAMNGLGEQVTVHPTAVSNTTGVVGFAMDNNDFIGASLDCWHEHDQRLEVPATTIDTFLRGAPETALVIKLDCQGFEPWVMAGAADVIRTRRPVWIVETIPFSLDMEMPDGRTYADFLSDFLIVDVGNYPYPDRFDLVEDVRATLAEQAFTDLVLVPKELEGADFLVSALLAQRDTLKVG